MMEHMIWSMNNIIKLYLIIVSTIFNWTLLKAILLPYTLNTHHLTVITQLKFPLLHIVRIWTFSFPRRDTLPLYFKDNL